MFLNNVVLKRKPTEVDSQATASYSNHKVIPLVCFVPFSHPLPKLLLSVGLRGRWTIDGEAGGWTDTLPDLEASGPGSFPPLSPYSFLSSSFS